MRVRKRGFMEEKAELAKLTLEKSGLSFLFFIFLLPHSSYFLLILPVPMVVFA